MPPRIVCGNPLFRDWVEAERKIAQDKGSKAADTYGKAVKSLNSCPIKYDHPRELVALKGIGPKIVELLTRKWRIHCEENNIEYSDSPAKKRKTKAKAPVASQNDDEDDEPPPTQPKPKRKVTAKTYIPNQRSGAYGILLGLLQAIDNPTRTTTVFLSKQDVIRIAQPYCDASYSHPEKGGVYSAWHSMKPLGEKGYVYRTGSPPKWCLTEEGYEVACQMRSLLPEYADAEIHPWLEDPMPGLALAITAPNRPRPPPREIPLNRPESSLQAAARSRPSLDTSRRESNPGRFQFWYIDNKGERVSVVDEASSRLDPDEFVDLRKIEFRHSQRTHPFAQQLKFVDAESRVRDGSGQATYFGYTRHEGAPPKCSKFEDAPAESTSASADVGGSGKKRGRSAESDDELDIEDAPASFRPPPKKTPAALFAELAGAGSSTFARTHSAPDHINNAASAKLAADAATRGMAGLGSTSSLSSIPTSATKAARPAPRLSSHVPINNPLNNDYAPEDDAENIPNFSAAQATVWPAGSYDIVLVVDTREVESTTRRDKFREELTNRGLNVETRALSLGDFLWIAKRKDGVDGEEDECVLDYVVERKRLDDLLSSIKDGRYNEQCFRLNNSAIQHVYYVVEDYQAAAKMETEGPAILTAKSQIQVHNRFFLKETHKLSDTIDFIKIMTDVIIASHAHTDLRIIPSRYLTRSSFCGLQRKLRSTSTTGKESSFLVSFAAYQELNNKSSSTTLQELFACMMLVIKGLSAEKVGAMLAVWETPRALWEDLKAWNAEPMPEPELGKDGKPKKKKVRGKECFFADRVQGEGRRKIPDAVSRTMYNTLMNLDGDD